MPNPSGRDDVAIIGMACLFPGAPDLRAYWENIIHKVDAVGDPPEEWNAELYWDPDASTNDRTYCKKGGWLGDLARFDPLKYGIMPNSVDGGEPDQFLALRVAYDALADAGYLDRPMDRERAEVVIGRGTYINRGFTNVVQHGVMVDRILEVLRRLHPEHAEDELRALKEELKSSLPPFNAEMAPGLVPNVMSGRIANRLDLMGPNYTLDAACASSLLAVDRAAQDLLDGRCDLALVGGVHASTPAPILIIFSQLGALSRRGQLRAFDKDADGTLLGEGLGFIVLKRRADAERDGDRIYALLKGIGSASDGRALGLLAPRLEGEVLALRRTYQASGIDPHTVALIEAHGTGTSLGDATEIRALREVFGGRRGELPEHAVGTVKSMISHLIPAAGIAGIIKSALALHHRVLPPTLHCDEPNPELGLDETPFYINTETRPWIHGGPGPRRAGVNAFGFGGINAHAVLEEYVAAPRNEAPALQHTWDAELFVLQGDTRDDLVQAARGLAGWVGAHPDVVLKDLAFTLNSALREGTQRLAIVAGSVEELARRLSQALGKLEDPRCTRIRDAAGVYFFAEPLARQGTLAFLFPGEGSQYLNMLDDLCIHFPEVRAWFDVVDRAFTGHGRRYLPSQVLFPPPGGAEGADEDRLWQMDVGPEVIFAANQAMFSLLRQLEIRPDAVVGHSTGEYSALVASGVNPRDGDLDRLATELRTLNEFYERMASAEQIARGVLLTVGGADREDLLARVEASEGRLHLAMDNCPHQAVLCGTEEEIERIVPPLQAKGAICGRLPFDRAYHTPLFEPFSVEMEEFLQHLRIEPPAVPLYSCATTRPYPHDPAEIRRLAAAQWSRPVRFRETVEAMYADGVRVFVEVGPRNNLTSFVDDILRGRPHLAAASNVPQRTGIAQLNHLVGMLAAHGVPMKLDPLYARRAPVLLSLEGGEAPAAPSRAIRLAMGLQPLRLSPSRPAAAPNAGSKLSVDAAPAAPVPAPNGAPVPAASNGAFGSGSAAAPAPAATNGNGGAADGSAASEPPAASVAAGTGPTTVPFTPVHVQTSGPAAADRAGVMSAYLTTMEQFLAVQQEVMQTFLAGRQAATASQPAPSIQPVAAPPLRAPAPAEAPPIQPLAAPPPAAPAPAETPAEEFVAPAAAPPVFAPAPEAEPSAPAWTRDSITQALLRLVGDRTGYPVEMLSPVMDLEADLSIDSIKRVEILGAFRRETGLLQPRDMDRVTGLKTLRQIVDYVVTRDGDAAALPVAPAPAVRAQQETQSAALPFIGEIVSVTPGEELVARRTLTLDDDTFLRDHTLGRGVSRSDPSLPALPVVPLTVSMEMLAEAAAALLPGRVVTGMIDVRAYRFITLDRGAVTLRMSARRTAEDQVEVQMHDEAAQSSPVPLIEATVLLGDRHPAPPPAGEFPLRAERPSRYDPARLYDEVMFHGPTLQGVASVDRWGEDGCEGTLRGLPSAGLFRALPEPGFLIDPVPLDATGQLVGYWTAETLETGFHVFPFKLERLELFGPALRPGQTAACRCRIALLEDWQMRSDIDVVVDGTVRMRLTGWWDRRFTLPDAFYRLRLAPSDILLAEPWPAPAAALAPAEAHCVRLDALTPELLEAHDRIWQRVLAHLVLSRREREAWAAVPGPERRRTEWLLGRAAAKDAVRLILRARHGIHLPPADVEIEADAHGRPLVRLPASIGIDPAPVVSISHAAGVATAIAADGAALAGIGIDREPLGRVRAGWEDGAFGGGERALLDALPADAREEWALRCWCAKEAAGKALGRGLGGAPSTLRVHRVDPADGVVEIEADGERILAWTVREEGEVAAVAGRAPAAVPHAVPAPRDGVPQPVAG